MLLNDLPETVNVALELPLFEHNGHQVVAKIKGGASAISAGQYRLSVGAGARLLRRRCAA